MRRSLPNAVIAIALSFLLVACSGADVNSLVRQITGQPAPAASVSTDDATTQAVKDTIDRANGAQAKAFNTGDPTLMRDTATSEFYRQLVNVNRDLAAAGVTEIEIVSTDFQSVGVDGANATATTFETWRSTYNDGSSEETTARNDYTLVLDGSTWRIATNDQPSAQLQPGSPQTQPDTTTPSSAAITTDTSTNWSGYAATGGTFTSVTGTWTVPTVTATITGADATWVGIGGINTSDLIQAGTQATVSGGEVAYGAWIEMLPAASRPISLTVGPGDSVTVTITQKGALDWSIDMKNNSTGGRYSTTVQYRSSRASAEWVQEAPSVARGIVPLDDFGTLRFTGASAVRDGASLNLAALGAQAITMINSLRQPLAIPSVIGGDGASFTVTRTDNQALQTVPGTGRRRRG